jgi:hypothetical protein
MKNDFIFQQELNAVNFLTESEADIFNENLLKMACTPKKKFSAGDMWLVHKNYKRRSVATGICYRF